MFCSRRLANPLALSDHTQRHRIGLFEAVHQLDAFRRMTILRPFIATFMVALVLMSGFIAGPSQATERDQVTIRSLQHNDGGRLLIEWPTPVRVLQKREGNQLILRFSRPISSDFGPALRSLSAYLDVDRTKIEATDLIVTLQTGVSANLEIKKQKIVAIDFSRIQPNKLKVEFDISALTNGVRLSMNWPHPQEFDTHEQNGKLFVTLAPGGHINSKDLSYLNETLQPWFSKVQYNGEHARASLVFDLRPLIVSSVQGSENRVTVDLTRNASTLAAPDNTPIPAIKPRDHVPISRSVGITLPPIPERRPETAAFPVHVEEARDVTASSPIEKPEELIFNWKTSAGLAVFKRAGYLWVVFDRPSDSSISDLPPQPPAPLGAGELIPAENATIIRYRMKSDADFITRHDGRGQWTIRPHLDPMAPDPVPILPAGLPGALQAIGVSSGRIIDVIDPIVGDQISIWPLLQARVGQQGRRRFVDLEFLESIQGLVWRPLSDHINVNTSSDGIRFSSAQGLALSSRPARSSKNDALAGQVRHSSDGQPKLKETQSRLITSKPKVNLENDRTKLKQAPSKASDRSNEAIAFQQQVTHPPSSYLDLAGFSLDRALVLETRRLLRQAVWKSAAEEKDQARLNLAKLLVAERLASEAKIVLSTIAENAQDSIAASKRALQGASAFLSGDLDRASAILGASEFDRDDEVGIWRAALDSLDKDWQSAAKGWKSSDKGLNKYPPKLRLELGLLALETAIETNDDTMIRRGLRRLKELKLKPHELAQIDRLHALRARRGGNLPQAEKILRVLAEDNTHELSRIAELELASIALRSETDDPHLLASLHDRLPLWRGHPQEISMIDRLAGWYREAKKPRTALELWEYLAKIHPKTRKDSDIKLSRQKTFAEAINHLAGKDIKLLDAYAIYLDFKGLLPDGENAKIIYRNLAEILAELDLINESADVLTPLISGDINDIEQAEIGAELARLLILQKRQKEALAVLVETELSDDLGREMLVAERRLLKADALIGLDKDEEALKLLQDLQSLAAHRLQAKVFWKRRDWSRLASVIESFLNDSRLSSPLNRDDQKFVLWLALAQGHLGQVEKLDRLRQTYTTDMTSSTWSEALLIGTQGRKQGEGIVSVLADVEKQLAELRRFQNGEVNP